MLRGACRACSSRSVVVVDRMCNYSAFSGYHRTPSLYSSVRCLGCGTYWRTKAGYVQFLRDATEDERTRPIKVLKMQTHTVMSTNELKKG